MATTVAALQATLDADTKKFDAAMRASDDRFHKTGASIKKGAVVIGAALGTVGIAAAIGAKKAIDAASDLNESVNAVNVVFGKASKRILAFGEDSATAVGLSQRAFNQAVTPIGNSLRNMGLGADEAAKKSIELTTRAADMASVFNVDVSESLTSIQAALRGEFDPIEKFVGGMSEASVTAYAVKKGIAEAGAELTANQKTTARLGFIMENSSRLQGDFANTSGSLANQQRILKAQFEDVSAEVGTVLLPVATKLLGIVADLVPKVLDLGRSIAGFLGPALSTVVGYVKDFADGLGGGGSGSVADTGWKVTQFIKGQLIPALQSIWEWIKKYILPVITDLARIAVRTFQRIKQVIDDNRPAIDRIIGRIRGLLEILGKVWHVIWIVLKPVLQLVFQEILPRLLSVVITYIDKVSGAIEKVIGWFVKVKDKGKDVWGSITGFIGDAWRKTKLFRDALVSMLDRVTGPLRTLAGIVKGIGGFFSRAAGAVKNIGGDGLVSALTGARGAGAPQRAISSTLWDDIGIGQSMGLGISSGYRPGAVTSSGNPSLHGVFPSKAVDMAGSWASMARFFALEAVRGGASGIRELIFANHAWYPGTGVVSIAGSQLAAEHMDHVHVGSYDRGGYLRPGWNLAYNGLGRPEPVGAGTTYNINGAILDGEKLLRYIREQEAKHQRRGGMS